MLEHEVHVWRAELDRDDWPAPSRLPVEERRRADRMPGARMRRRWVASRWALREVLAHYLGEDPAAIALRLGPHGKPALDERSAALRFNLSHSAGLALIALTGEREVGVDVEQIGPRRNLLGLAERALDPVAAAAVRSARPQDQPAAFHDAWTRREAVVKCLGSGLWAPLPATPVAVSGLDPGPGFSAALAVSGDTMPPLRFSALAGESHRCSSHRPLARAL